MIMFFWSMINLLEILVSATTFYFAYSFIEKRDMPLKLKFLIYLPVIVFSFFIPSKVNIPGFTLASCEAQQGSLIYFFYSIEVFISLCLVFYLITKIFKSHHLERKKNIIFTVGIICFLASFSSTNLFASITSEWEILQYGLFGMPVFLGFLSYLILKYEAFDIKVIAGQFLTVTVWIGVFSQFFIVQDRSNQILTAITLALVTYFGWMLFKSVKEEVVLSGQLSLDGRKLAGLNTKLEELDRAKSEFISIASHQLRTPLTSVKGFTSLLLDNTLGKVPLKQKKEIEKIFVNNEKLCLLVEDMLNASRLEAGRLEYELEEADAVSIIESTIKVISLYAKSRKIKLILNLPKTKLMAIVDQRKLSEIISNLVDNGIKYTPKGSVTVTIEKINKNQKVGKADNSPTARRAWVRISVKDTGLGMEEKQLENIFDKFKEGDEAVRNLEDKKNLLPSDSIHSPGSAGTGLGVYISRQMAEAMGGKLYAESQGKGRGSTFTLELPLVTKK